MPFSLSKRQGSAKAAYASYNGNFESALTSNPGDVRMPVLGIPELCTIGVHSNSMANNHGRRFPRDRLDVCSDAQEF